MNKAELIVAVAERCNMKRKEAEAAVNGMLDIITETLTKDEKVQLVGFGTFEVRKRAARKGRNPQTGEEIVINASQAPVFKVGKGLKDALGDKAK